MKYKIIPGNFQRLGVALDGGTACFTFEVKTNQKTAILLFDRHTKKLLENGKNGKSFRNVFVRQ